MFTPYPPTAADIEAPGFRRRTETSLNAFARLADDPVSGVHMAELREYLYRPFPAPPWIDDLLLTKPLTHPPPPFPENGRATASLRPHIQMDRYLPWLHAQLAAAGARTETLLPPSFNAVFDRGHSTIVNCAGLGSRTLLRDELLRPMHGQVLHVPNDIGLTYSLHDDAPDGEVAYIFVFRRHLILGGTFDLDREDPVPDEGALNAIVDRCRNLLRMDGHPRWKDLARTRLEARAAPRPCRGPDGQHEQIRLERETHPGGRTIVHNYGHGRTGVSLSWGCAEEAADLALS